VAHDTIGNSGTHRGYANLEFILSLPLVLVLLLAIVSGAYALMTRLTVSHRVRREAWVQRHGTPPGGMLAIQSSSNMGIVPGLPVAQGEIGVEETKAMRLWRLFPVRNFHSTFDHHVMGGSWDSQTIPFEPRGTLQPDPRMSVYSPGVSPALFEALAEGLNLLGALPD
jgi:hypothetical protein